MPARGRFVIRIRFSDYTGKTVLHCHILNHEDEGMMAALEIVK
ncbi:multicopper oxidase domain-containing protein [Streptomyces sp. NPDC058476]